MELVQGFADGVEAGDDDVGGGAQGVAIVAVLEVGEGHVEGEEEGAQFAQIIGDAEQRELGAGGQSPVCRGCRWLFTGRGTERRAMRLQQGFEPRDLLRRAAGEEAAQPGDVIRRQISHDAPLPAQQCAWRRRHRRKRGKRGRWRKSARMRRRLPEP